jgi:hypothetical protein
MSQSNRSDRTAVPSAFTNYDDACLGTTTTVPPRRLSTPDGTRIRQSVGWSSGGNYDSPEVSLSLRTNSASPELGLNYLLPVNPTGGHSFNCVVHSCEPRSRLNHGLEKASASLEHGFALDISNRRAPDVTRSNRVDVLSGGFRYTYHSSNHYDLDNFPIKKARVRDRALGPGLGFLRS